MARIPTFYFWFQTLKPVRFATDRTSNYNSANPALRGPAHTGAPFSYREGTEFISRAVGRIKIKVIRYIGNMKQSRPLPMSSRSAKLNLAQVAALQPVKMTLGGDKNYNTRSTQSPPFSNWIFPESARLRELFGCEAEATSLSAQSAMIAPNSNIKEAWSIGMMTL
jgi:hypothetical protein